MTETINTEYQVQTTYQQGVARIVTRDGNSQDLVFTLDSHADLRALTLPAPQVVAVKYGVVANDGLGGVFVQDPSDTTSADNGRDVIVSTDSYARRWKLLAKGESAPIKFTTTNDTPHLTDAIYSFTDGTKSGAMIEATVVYVATANGSSRGVKLFAVAEFDGSNAAIAESSEYPAGAVTTDIYVSGNDVGIAVTGFAATTVNWKIIIDRITVIV